MSTGDASTTPGELLREVRETPTYHWLAVIGACLLGLVLATVHWLGLVVGGALVGLVATTLKRALLAGLGFAVLVLTVWAGLFVVGGVFGKVVAMGQITAISVAMGIALPVLGSLLRGVV
jgi:hypothetical protein